MGYLKGWLKLLKFFLIFSIHLKSKHLLSNLKSLRNLLQINNMN